MIHAKIEASRRELISFLDYIATRHDGARVFDDFLTLVVCVLARQTQEDWYHSTIRKYDEDEMHHFSKMLGLLLMMYDAANAAGDWIDPLGEIYEEISGRFKRSGMGQFFTPKAVCDVTAAMMAPEGPGKKVLEPSAGSGRMILAMDKIAKGNIYQAQDLDKICVKMCAINMALHGVRGVVYHMDTLRMKVYNTLIVNTDFHLTETPCILRKEAETVP